MPPIILFFLAWPVVSLLGVAVYVLVRIKFSRKGASRYSDARIREYRAKR